MLTHLLAASLPISRSLDLRVITHTPFVCFLFPFLGTLTEPYPHLNATLTPFPSRPKEKDSDFVRALVELQKEAGPYDMALECKEKGNTLFKGGEKHYDAARDKYTVRRPEEILVVWCTAMALHREPRPYDECPGFAACAPALPCMPGPC